LAPGKVRGREWKLGESGMLLLEDNLHASRAPSSAGGPRIRARLIVGVLGCCRAVLVNRPAQKPVRVARER
jgi:hypothetical protein